MPGHSVHTVAVDPTKFAVGDDTVANPRPIVQVAFTTIHIELVAVAPTIIARENRASSGDSVASCFGDVRRSLVSRKELALAVQTQRTRTTVIRVGRNAGELVRDRG
jgi:hypothetical protein